MLKRRPDGSGVVQLGGEHAFPIKSRPILQANARMTARLRWHFRMWPWSLAKRRRRA